MPDRYDRPITPEVQAIIDKHQSKILHLTLKKQWFDMIKSGVKKEEYREIKPYWCARLLEFNKYAYTHESLKKKSDKTIIDQDVCFDILNAHDPIETLRSYRVRLKDFDCVTFKNGYSSDAPVMTIKKPVITIDYGFPDWGAVPGRKYFVIKLYNY